MPKTFLGKPIDEKKWQKAKDIVKREYGFDEEDERFWKLVTGIWKKMKGESEGIFATIGEAQGYAKSKNIDSFLLNSIECGGPYSFYNCSYRSVEAAVRRTRTKTWITEQDERVCEFCNYLHGKTINENDFFREIMKGKNYDVFGPPAHPNCRCSLLFE